MPYTDTALNAAATGLTTPVTHLSLHTANPGTTGANEVTGGSPAYARKTVSWAAAASAQRASSTGQTFDVPAATDVVAIGLWDALTVGNFYGWIPLGNFAPQAGVMANTGDVITSYAHGLSNGQRVIVFDIQANGLPTGLTEGVVYFVVGATTDTFQVSLTSGGSAVTVSADGELGFTRCLVESFAGQGQATIASGGVVVDARFAG